MSIDNPLDDFLNIENLKSNIHKFRNSDCKIIDINYLEELITKILSIVSFSIPYYLTGRVYRIRRIVNQEQHKTKSDLWAPPINCVNSYGRFNKPNESILYTSFYIDTAIEEVRLLPGEHFSLAIFDFKDSEYPRNNTLLIDNTINYCKNDTFKENTYFAILKQFLFDELTGNGKDNNSNYIKTNIIINSIFKTFKKDSVVYPSFFNNNKHNLAIKGNSASELVNLSQVLTFEYIGKNADNTFSLRLYQSGNFSDDSEFIEYKETNIKDRIINFSFKGKVNFQNIFI